MTKDEYTAQLEMEVYRLRSALRTIATLLNPPEEVQTVRELVEKVLSEEGAARKS